MNTWIRPGLIFVLALLSVQAFTQRHPEKVASTISNEEALIWESGTDAYFEEQIESSPAAAAQYHANEQLLLHQHRYNSLPGSRSGGFSIPVVVHIVHDQNGISNIPNSQVYSALNHLNQAFANQTPFNSPDGVDNEITFCLAQRDPLGDSTLGITRSASTLTFLTRETQDSSLKALKFWPSDDYLNIWVVASITSNAFGPSITGYTTLPFNHGNSRDGIVVEANFFGTSPDRSKVLVHEAGHYLGLHNTFYGGCDNTNCQTSGDKVCDTPPDGSTANANGFVNSCLTDEDDPSPLNPFRSTALGGLGDQPDQIENYMDKGDLRVQTRFTPGQKDRMHSQLQLFRSSLLDSRSCLPPCPASISASFTAPQQITFGDSAQLLNGSLGASDYSWSINGQQFSTDTDPSWTPSNTGIFEIVLEAGNGSAGCTEIASQTILVVCDFQAEIDAPQISSLPGNQLSFSSVNGIGNGLTWLLDGVPVGNQSNLDYTFLNAGGYTLQLIAQGNGCVDSSDIEFVEIGVCGIEAHTLNWSLGDSVGLNFKGEIPQNWNSGMFADEGCTTMSDDDGNLMFYSNGVTVWNKDHQPMPNGSNLLGNRSASQGVVAVPYPGSKTKYILFTNDAIEWTFLNGLRYNIIDMSLDGGRGDIVPGQKNIWLAALSSEMIAAVQNDNEKDYWLITHEAFGNRFLVYEINSNGINTTPISINAGPVITLATGAMKVSPNRKRLAITCNANGVRELLVMNFNPANGQLTSPISISNNPNIQIYGAEFSPDNSKVYFTTLSEVYQVDLSLGSQQAVLNSKTLIANATSNRILGMQRSVDGNIYIASGFFGKLHKIEHPNVPGAGCGFIWEGQDLLGRQGRWGLPNFAVGIPRSLQKVNIIGPDSACVGELVQYQVSKIDTGDVIGWELVGNGTLIPTMIDSMGMAMFSQPGMVAMVASRTTACGISRDTFSITAKPSPLVDLGIDTLLCNGSSLALNGAPNPGVSHVWSDGSNGNGLIAQQTGDYWVEATGTNGCTTTDSINIGELIPNSAIPQLGNDTSVCEGWVVLLDPGNHPGLDFDWQDGSELPTFTASQQGWYTVEVTNECGDQGLDSIFLTLVPAPNFTLGTDLDICPGDTVDLYPGADYPYVEWQDSSNNDLFQATQPGIYWCEVTNHSGCSSRDTIVLTPCLNPTAMDNPELLEVSVYPNPSNGDFNLLVQNAGMANQIELSVVNSLGKLVYRETRVLNNSTSPQAVKLNRFEDGLYYLTVKTDSDMEFTTKVMIRK